MTNNTDMKQSQMETIHQEPIEKNRGSTEVVPGKLVKIPDDLNPQEMQHMLSSAVPTKEIRSFKKLLAVPHVVERNTQRPFSDNWFSLLLARQIELRGQLSPYLLQLVLEDLHARKVLTADQIRSWESYKPKELRRRKLANNRKRTRFDLSLPVELKWVGGVLTKFAVQKNGVKINQANYVWNLLVQKELRAMAKAMFDDEKKRKAKYALWIEEWTVHCSEFRRVGADFFKSESKAVKPEKQQAA